MPETNAAPDPAQPKEKIIVAVHGMGKHVRSETIQAVAYQLCRYCDLPAAIPLGHFTAELVQQPDDLSGTAVAAFMVKAPEPALPAGLGFAEVYWADIPMKLAADGYYLEESKKWAVTLVNRVRAMDRSRAGTPNASDREYALASTVIAEILDGVRVLENLLFLADRAHIFKFDLNQLLVDTLGHVQVVTEFKNLRKQIVGVFTKVMAKIHAEHPQAEIYIVAHSEGTAISLFGILEALHQLPPTPPAPGAKPDGKDPGSPSPAWVMNLRGLMTIGSPLNKHLLLWPELWTDLTPPPQRPLQEPIRWRNYYDYGDPVGFRLDATRAWLQQHGWEPYFEFDKDKHDIGFARYFFPGKAHTDYWTDAAVFGHFIQDVVQPPATTGWQQTERKYDKPGSRFWARITSCVLPFVFAAVLLLTGVYLLYTAVNACLNPTGSPGVRDSAQDVCAIGLLVAGITAEVRIPRLTRAWRWRVGGFALFLVALWVFPRTLTDGTQTFFVLPFLPLARTDPGHAVIAALHETPSWLGLADVSPLMLPIVVTAVLLVIIGWVVSRICPSAGARPLIVIGGAVILGIVGVRLSEDYDGVVELNALQARVAEKSVAAKEIQDGEEIPAGDQMKETRPAKACLGLLAEYAKNPRQAANFSAFLATADPAAVARKLSLPTDNRTVSAVRQQLHRFESPADSAQPTRTAPQKGPIWPVILAGAAFVYLWWLAAVLFDLTVVWHHYIRQSAILDRLVELTKRPVTKPTASTTTT